MVLKGKRQMPFTNLAEVAYRCETCGTETKRIIKESLGYEVEAYRRSINSVPPSSSRKAEAKRPDCRLVFSGRI
jgi:hypothetical protein